MNSYFSQSEFKELCGQAPLDDLAKARCFVALRRVMLTQRVPEGEVGIDLRDRVARRLGFGLSGKTLERLALILDLPPAIQRGVASRTITKRLATRILQETHETRQQIAADITAGTHNTAIIQKYNLSAKPARTPHAALASLLKSIIADLPLVTAYVELLADARLLTHHNVATISRTVDVLGRLCERHAAKASEELAASPKFTNIAMRRV